MTSAVRQGSGPPSPKEISLAESRAPSPSYWFGSVKSGNQLSRMTGAAGGGTVSFSYSPSCNSSLNGSPSACSGAAETASYVRAGYLSRLPGKKACWQRFGQAWVLPCAVPYRLLTGDRVVEFVVREPSSSLEAQAWRQSIALLERFDRGGGPKFPAPARLTCDELVPISAAQRKVIPRALLPSGCES